MTRPDESRESKSPTVISVASTLEEARERWGNTVGLLAGGGRFPYCFADAARKMGLRVHCVGLKGHAEPELAKHVDEFAWCGIAKMGRMIRQFKRADVRTVAMAGKIFKHHVMYDPWRIINLWPDLRFVRFWFTRTRGNNKDDSILLDVIDEFRKDGLVFESALEICPDLLAKEGVLTKRQLVKSDWNDVAFGWELAREMGRLDVGQSVMVKERAVIAVEAIEGTDAAIRRAGTLCPMGGFVVVKVAKPKQDMRFDVPTVACEPSSQ